MVFFYKFKVDSVHESVYVTDVTNLWKLKKIETNKPFEKLSSIYIYEKWFKNVQKIKNNNLDLLSLIREMAILRHLPGNVESVNILYNLFWEYGIPQQDFPFQDYKAH